MHGFNEILLNLRTREFIPSEPAVRFSTSILFYRVGLVILRTIKYIRKIAHTKIPRKNSRVRANPSNRTKFRIPVY